MNGNKKNKIGERGIPVEFQRQHQIYNKYQELLPLLKQDPNNWTKTKIYNSKLSWLIIKQAKLKIILVEIIKEHGICLNTLRKILKFGPIKPRKTRNRPNKYNFNNNDINLIDEIIYDFNEKHISPSQTTCSKRFKINKLVFRAVPSQHLMGKFLWTNKIIPVKVW